MMSPGCSFASGADPGAVVHGPVVFEEADFEIFRDRCSAVTIDIGNEVGGFGQKIPGIEIEDGRKPDLASGRIDPDVALLAHECTCGHIELTIETVRRKCVAGQTRTAHNHAGSGAMYPFLASQ